MDEWVIPSACEGYNISVTFSIDYVLPSYDLQHVKTSRYSLLIRLVFPFLFYCFYMYKFETFFISEIYRGYAWLCVKGMTIFPLVLTLDRLGKADIHKQEKMNSGLGKVLHVLFAWGASTLLSWCVFDKSFYISRQHKFLYGSRALFSSYLFSVKAYSSFLFSYYPPVCSVVNMPVSSDRISLLLHGILLLLLLFNVAWQSRGG